ncbi:LPPG:FO 2-phospho-L-lactate transferase [Methanomicrobium sp. W14]|uniref:2-phospho-L-lactate transferase n=1 Tax=Methanomicrobium sp. W14 TaxID=2817839 RepID=UPI001AE1DB25|nr:2-phospho-L-lactate transferase [Methanomicrobium sp. W14]MBP2132897.1 LPPG:FO 2-phospho-L-lactate transferase [Methanomicrobium sp. W14]
MKITFLSGGTGTPKLIRGFRKILNDEDISVIVNTAEDMWIYGSHLSPDIDTLMYLFSGMLDTDRWWGIKGDTTVTNDFLKSLGEDVYLTLGDKDRAVNIARGRLLREGKTLTEATSELCRRLGVSANILPMCDTEITTNILTEKGLIHFQEYWVKHRANIGIRKIKRTFKISPIATNDALSSLKQSDLIIVGPSNPVTSISPILECSGIIQSLKEKPVVAVSPFIGDKPVSGPAKELMDAWNIPSNSKGAYSLYRDFTDLFIQDIRDSETIEGAVKFDTLMLNENISKSLAENIIKEVRELI